MPLDDKGRCAARTGMAIWHLSQLSWWGFSLDEELALEAGSLTPQVLEWLVRLAVWMPDAASGADVGGHHEREGGGKRRGGRRNRREGYTSRCTMSKPFASWIRQKRWPEAVSAR